MTTPSKPMTPEELGIDTTDICSVLEYAYAQLYAEVERLRAKVFDLDNVLRITNEDRRTMDNAHMQMIHTLQQQLVEKDALIEHVCGELDCEPEQIINEINQLKMNIELGRQLVEEIKGQLDYEQDASDDGLRKQITFQQQTIQQQADELAELQRCPPSFIPYKSYKKQVDEYEQQLAEKDATIKDLEANYKTMTENALLYERRLAEKDDK